MSTRTTTESTDLRPNDGLVDGETTGQTDGAPLAGAPAIPLQKPADATTTAPSASPTGRRYLQLVLVLGSLIALGPLTIDMYLPALPTMAAEFRASDAAAQFTLTGIMLGLAVGQLVIGPISDAVGRRLPLLVGVVAHGLMSVLCALAPNIATLSVVRVLQGFAGAAISVVAMAVVRDLFSGRRAATLLSHLMLVLGVAPILAPTVGGYLLKITDWRGIFVALGLAAAALVAVAWFGLRETLPVSRRLPARLGATGRTYVSILGDRTFVGLVLVAGLVMAALFSYVAGSPFVLQQLYGLDPQQFGLVFGLNAAGLIAASQTNPWLLRRYSPQQVLSTAVAVGMLSTLTLVVMAALAAPLWAVLVPLFVTVAVCGFSFPNAPALALSRHGEAAGTAAALLGSAQFGIAAAVAPLVGALGTESAVPMAGVMLAAIWLAAASLLVLVRPWKLPSVDADA